jgi:hypothetical protein
MAVVFLLISAIYQRINLWGREVTSILHTGGCTKFRHDFKVPDSVLCCNTCHADEWEYSTALCTIHVVGGIYKVCCALSIWYDEQKEKRKLTNV